jgi:eukaryotic-like serine/threonine-protein kinase
MVHVPGGLYRIASRDLQSLSTMLDDFFIDRHEVTNADFVEFVDAGGYARREFWSDLHDVERSGAGDAMHTFVDRTGMAAPRNWSGQRPPSGLEQHPVTDVSWYEASAYCRYRRKTLPTLFEWEKAARDGVTSRFGVELPWGYVGPGEPSTGRANFGGQGTVPVGSYPFGVSPYGAYDMAGNVKEWLRNRSEDGRAVTGGSWADPIYIFSEAGLRLGRGVISFHRLPLRAHRADERGAPAAQGGEPLRLAVQTPVYTPVSDAEFQLPCSRSISTMRQSARRTRGGAPRCAAAGSANASRTAVADGARVVAYLFLPKSATAAVPDDRPRAEHRRVPRRNSVATLAERASSARSSACGPRSSSPS